MASFLRLLVVSMLLLQLFPLIFFSIVAILPPTCFLAPDFPVVYIPVVVVVLSALVPHADTVLADLDAVRADAALADAVPADAPR